MHRLLQTVAWWSRPIGFQERCRARFGKRFTVRLIGQSPFVILSEPEQIKQLFQAPPDVLHPGEGAYVLEPVVGRHSVILLDEEPHMEQRKLLLPAFHGDSMQRLSGLMTELAEREIASWPRYKAVALHPALQCLTLEVMLRAVFGLRQGSRLDRLRDLLTKILSFGESPLSLMPPGQRLLAGRGPMAQLERTRAETDELIFGLIEERRREQQAGEDVLALLLQARHEDDSPMGEQEVRDELMTALVAGHETTASQLAWAVDRLSREPAIQRRLHAELSHGDDEAYLTATIQEILRHKPVLPNPEPRLVKKPIEIGGFTYQPGAVLFASAYLVQHDPDIYPDPYAFRPERFLGQKPGTYTWIPFGGGRRRCIGAAFAELEMKLVLRALLERCELAPAGERPAVSRRRGIALSPSTAGMAVLHDRPAFPARPAAAAAAAPSPA